MDLYNANVMTQTDNFVVTGRILDLALKGDTKFTDMGLIDSFSSAGTFSTYDLTGKRTGRTQTYKQTVNQDVSELSYATSAVGDPYVQRVFGGGNVKLVNSTVPKFAQTHAQVIGDVVLPNVANGHKYIVTQAGTTGSSEPTWPTTAGGTVTSGTVVFQEDGSDTPVLRVVSGKLGRVIGYGCAIITIEDEDSDFAVVRAYPSISHQTDNENDIQNYAGLGGKITVLAADGFIPPTILGVNYTTDTTPTGVWYQVHLADLDTVRDALATALLAYMNS